MARRNRPPRTLNRALVTPEGVALNLKLASAGTRASAFLLDWLILIAVLIAATLLVMLLFWAIGKSYPTVFAVIWLLFFFVLRNFYFTLMESGARAATFGKRMLKLRVVARDGGRLTGAAVIARNLMREIEIFLPLTFLAFGAAEGFVDRWTTVLGFAWAAIFLFFPLFNRHRLRAGDLIAGTWVVENARRAIGEDLVRADGKAADLLRFTPEELAVYGQFELQRLEDVLRRDDADSITMVAAAIRRKLGRDDTIADRVFLDSYYRALRGELERKLLFGRRKRDKFDDAS
ncbi:RDD family protein [Stakelama marina]|uniref:RDD family protein n=1 Tax=Stakelama marina TaxID=2826939 RepID=A0A8T4I7P0_9SPHN|nr:RDD family protein [Stakelama marina]MBR0551008.1 RDD family protein [Stakelama marina]